MTSNIIMSIINKERYSDLLKIIPHRDVLDLSIVYRRVTATPDNGFCSILINCEMMEKLELTEEELYNIAKKNTERLFPYCMENIDENFYVLTNPYRIFGAVAAFESDEIEKLADYYENSLYILPSSIHEVFIIPDYGQGADYMQSVVKEANRTIVKSKEVLSDNVYYFDYEEKEIRIAE